MAVLALLGLFAALARLPLISDPVDVSPDGCEYLGIARHLISEGRWTSSLKWNFFTDAPVVHPALTDRPPLYPLWAAGWMTLSTDPMRQIWLARLGNLLLAAIVPATLYWALVPAVSEVAAALAAFIFMLYPGFLRNSAEPLTEPLFLLLVFGSLGRFLRAAFPVDWIVAGLLAALSFLTRPTGIILPVLYSAVLLVQTAGERRQATARVAEAQLGPVRSSTSSIGRAAAAVVCRLSAAVWHGPFLLVLAGFIVPLIPYWIVVTAQTGSPLTSILRYNYSIRHIDEGTFYGFERSFEPPAVFVWHHVREIGHLVARQWATMGSALGRSLQYLLPLGLFWRRGSSRKQAVLLGLALGNFLIHALSWTVWGAARYLFPTYVVSMALLLDAPVRWASGELSDGEVPNAIAVLLSAGAIALGASLTLNACLWQDARLYREKARPFAGVQLGWAYAAAGHLLSETPSGTICATNQPWMVNLLARRPAVIAPRFRDADQLRRYVACYRPNRLALFVTKREPEDVATALRVVNGLWTRPAVRSELTDTLDLERAVLHAERAPRQALLIFRVHPKALSGG
jgi:4-amino-4-deoxy-L-arabinose transferase-like glycosyltransferase